MSELDKALADNIKLRAQILEAENDLLRETVDCYSSYVDPSDAARGPDGAIWSEIGAASQQGGGSNTFFANERELAEARHIGRQLERSNEFAINGHENRINYIIGTGFTYQAVATKGESVPAGLVARVQELIDQFLDANRWAERQQEIVRRRDRDGEVFLRFFTGADASLQVRFVEPDQVFRPSDRTSDPAVSFGVETDPEDVETILRYWIDETPVEADEIQHRKNGVDRNVKRGVPLFYSVRNNLWRAEKLLHNMASVADIQTAIAMIRRHDRTSRSAAETFRDTGPTVTTTKSNGTSSYFRRYAPGTILDVPKTVEYEFPAAGLDAARYVKVLQAILRSVAARLVFPEFMLTSDASNANYSSTLVAEGPAVKMFQRWQAEMKTDDSAVMERIVTTAIRAGKLSREANRLVSIQIGVPRVATRDERVEAEVNRIYHKLGVKSKQTIAAEVGLDYEQERKNLEAK